MENPRTAMHSAHHASDETVNPPTLLNQRYEGGDSTFITGRVTEVRKDHLLEGVDLVLQPHEVGDGLVSTSQSVLLRSVHHINNAPLIGIIDTLQRHVFLVLE